MQSWNVENEGYNGWPSPAKIWVDVKLTTNKAREIAGACGFFWLSAQDFERIIPLYCLILSINSYHNYETSSDNGIMPGTAGLRYAIFGASMFGARSNQIAPWMSIVGKYSFILWLPVVIIGVTLRITAKRIR